MKSWFPFIIIGLTSGSVYALAAMGLVVTYKTSGVFNFAHGAVGMIATYVFYSLRVDAQLPTLLAVLVVLLVVAPLFGLMLDRLLFRHLAGATSATYVVVSLGLLVALQGLAIVVYGARTRTVDSLFPRSTYRLGDFYVGWDQTIVVLIAASAGLALAWFFRRTHLGLATRAVVENPELTELAGTSAPRVTALSWMLGTSLAALAGILLAPVIGLNAAILTLLVLQAFGAAAVGRLTSISMAYAGALGIGVAAALATKFAATKPFLAGVPTSLPFIILFLVLVLTPRRAFSEVTGEAKTVGARSRSQGRVRRGFPVRALALWTSAAAVVPLFVSGSHLLITATTLAFVLVFSSLSLLVGTARQVSLAHVVFAAFGATTLAHLLSAGVPYVPALVLAGLFVVPVGALVAIPALRLSGLFLALATLGFAKLAQDLIFPTSLGFGSVAQVFIPRPELLSGDVPFYYFVLVAVVLGVAMVETVRVTRLGRMLRALADSRVAVESLGINPTASRVLLFCISAFLAGVAGGLLGSVTQAVNPVSFDFFLSLLWVAVLVTSGMATFGGSVLAAVLFIAVPGFINSQVLNEYQPVFFGVAAIMLAQLPNGLVGLLRRPDFERLAARDRWRLQTSRGRERITRLVRSAA